MKGKRHIMVLSIGVALAVVLSYTSLASTINAYFYDLCLRSTKNTHKANDIVVIGIDENSLKRFDDPLVLWHKYLAQVIEGVADGGAKAIALDIIPAISLERLAPEMDRSLISAIKYSFSKGTPVYIGFGMGEHGPLPHRKFLFAAAGSGFLNLYPDHDERIRKQIVLLTGETGHKTYSLPFLTVGRESPLRLNNSQGKIYIDYRLSPPPVLSFAQVYDWAHERRLDALDAFRDKIIFIGVAAAALGERYNVPFYFNSIFHDRIPGVLIHAYTAKTVLSTKFLRDVPQMMVWGLVIGTCVISGILFLLLSPWRAGGIIVALLISGATGIYIAFTLYWIIPAASLLFSFLIPGIVSGTYRYMIEYRQFRLLQRFFKSYVSPHVMREIIERPEMVSFEGTHITATVMFTDIRNFTALSEKINPRLLVAGLNRYFTEMTMAVTGADGYLNRYLGDGILAIFGVPNKLPDDGALAAVCCAMDMFKRLERLNESEIFPGVSEKVRIGIGIHTGEAIAGNIGCYEKMDYSIIGDTVNLAYRIESATKEYQRPLLISETTYERIKDVLGARFVASAKVKGRVQEVKLYEVLSIKKEDR